MDTNPAWYRIGNVDTIDSPALVVYKDRVKENIRKAISMVAHVHLLRPHVKTNKIAEVCQLMLSAGIQKFKCATIAEAEMLAMIAAPDVLLAYQPVGPKIQRYISLAKKYPGTQFSCLTDNEHHAQQLAQAFTANQLTANVFIDLNIGMNRTGIPANNALALYHSIVALKGIKVMGLHAYDGHISDSDPTIRKSRSDKAFEAVNTLAAAIIAMGHTPVIIAGGSPTFPIHATRAGVECSPGTFVFWDWSYKNGLTDQPFDYAALVITRVISILDKTTICLDLGHKSVAAENPLPRVHFLNEPNAVPTGQSEEHLVVTVTDSSQHTPGDVWYGAPVHICPTVALYDKAYVVTNNKVDTSWEVIARNRSITI